jgi:hypothetical protein
LQRAGPVNYHNSRCARTSRICEGEATTRLFSGNLHSHFLWVSNQRLFRPKSFSSLSATSSGILGQIVATENRQMVVA